LNQQECVDLFSATDVEKAACQKGKPHHEKYGADEGFTRALLLQVVG